MAEVKKVNLKKLKNRVTAQKNHYETYIQPRHKENSEYIFPNRGRFADIDTIPNDGKKRYSKVIDHTAGLHAGRLAAALYDGLTPPSRPWNKYEMKNSSFMDIESVKAHFQAVNETVGQTLHDTDFYNNIADFFKEMVGFAVGSIFVDSDPIDLINFHTFTVGEYYIASDSKGKINTWYRKYSDTVDNIVDKFGEENVSQRVKEMIDKQGHEYVSIVHAIEPNRARDITMDDNLNMPFISVYYEEDNSDDKTVLRESGYEEMPSIVGRWESVSTEVYGHGPADRALGTTKSLNQVEKDIQRASKKTIDPPKNKPIKSKNKKTGAGTTTYYDPSQGATGTSAAYQINYDFQGAILVGDKMRDALANIFNSDLFGAISRLDRSNMTATEISQRVAEAIRMLVEVVTRMNSEVLKPLLERVYKILERAGKFPEPPREIEGMDVDIVFISSLAQAQLAVGIAGIEQVLDFVTRVANVNPTIIDKFNSDEALDEYSRMAGTPVKIVRSDEDTAVIRQAQKVQESQLQTAEMMSQMADGAQKLGNTPMGTGSALDTVIEGVQGASR